MSLQVDGNTLTPAQVCAVARAQTASVELAAAARERMEQSRALIDRLAAGDAPIYAVNTGVGLLANVRIPRGDLDQLQRNVIRSHCVGVGEPLERSAVRAMMLIRANVLAKGFSGIRPLVAERLCDLINRGVTPVVPSQGSVGASGDLAPLAHMALVMIGEGEAEYEGAILPGAVALQRAGIQPIELHPKEGISLINGTQAMLAIGCLELEAAETLTESADTISAMTLDALRGTPRAFDARIHEARPHPGQLACAARLRSLLDGSEIRQSHIGCQRVQDAYSLRCIPQVHGPVRDALAEARRVFEIEINSATDNPLVFGEEILSGGNFHGESLAFQLDFLAVALAALAGISERRIDRLVNPALNEELPPFLAGHAGLESGLMMAQVTAASLVAENRVLAHPASTGSITTSGNKEDFVSMGMTSAVKLQRIVRNTRNVLAIEALAAARALDLLAPLKSSATLEEARARIRQVSPPIEGDRAFYLDIAALERLIAAGTARGFMIRRASESDAEELMRLINLAFQVEKFFLDTDRIALPEVCERLRSGAFLIAEEDGAMAGCVYAEVRGERGYFGLLSVDPSRQRSGLGKQLVSAAEEFCGAAGCRFMDLLIVNLREELPAYYTKLGYAETGRSELPASIKTKLPCHFIGMTKALT